MMLFDAELNMICRLGLQEQREMLEKMYQFDDVSSRKLRKLFAIDNERNKTVIEVNKKRRLYKRHCEKIKQKKNL